MSYILDALKKIEHEKSRKPATNGRVNISGELFQERKQPASKTGIWKIVAIIALLSLVVGGVAWFMQQGNDKKKSAVNRQILTLPVVAVKPPIPAPAQPTPPPVAATVQAIVPKNSSTVTNENEDKTVASSIKVRHSKRESRPHVVTKTIVQFVQAPADIKLSGIAWQDLRAGRRAVVNGFLLKEGDVVSGAKISEIHADKVIFTLATGVFELKLDAVLPAELNR